LVVVVAGVILLVLVDVAGVILLVLVDEAGVIFLVLVDEAGETSLVDVVGGAVDLVGGDGLIEVHMIGMFQMDGEDIMTVGDLTTRVGIAATAVAQIEAAPEAMTEEVIVGAEAAAGAGRVTEAAAEAGHAAEAVVAAGAGAMTVAQDQNAGPEQGPVLMCCRQLEQDLL
jgi:hypothetical protein